MDELEGLGEHLKGRPTLLCVDDERIVLTSLQEQLRNSLPHVTIEIAESGEEGLEVLEDLMTDGVAVPVVVSDQLMPGMRGEEFLAKVHERSPSTLNILLTGQATADAVGAAVNQARLYRYIGKPWAENDLTLTVSEAIRSWASSVALRLKDEELRGTHEASLRFVPQEFLNVLGKKRLMDVREGLSVECSMQVVFADMRSYSTIASSLGPKPAFDLLNEFVNILELEFRARDGFISGLEGDGVLALFSSNADDAVRASVNAHRKLFERCQNGKNEPLFEMGSAVHSGTLIMGTVGNSERLKCDVVGDPVNFCARLESATRILETPMLISDRVASELAGDIPLRRIPGLRIKGRSETATVFEVLDALPAELTAARTLTLEKFNEAMAHFENGDAAKGRLCLSQVAERDPSDKTAQNLVGLFQ